MTQRQKTIQNEVSLSGIGLHTGNPVTVRFKPAAQETGIRFIRVDLPGSPVIEARAVNVRTEARIPRCTSIGKGDAVIYTVEHLMSALCGLGIDNIDVEINSDELPGLDGSAIGFLQLLKEAGIVEQEFKRRYFDIKEPMGVTEGESSIFIVPAADLRISYTLDYDHPYLRSQFISTTVHADIFEREIAPCRTFCLEDETVSLREKGLGKGANYENTLVVGPGGVKGIRFAFRMNLPGIRSLILLAIFIY